MTETDHLQMQRRNYQILRRTWERSTINYGRQKRPKYTDWMKHRVDSDVGKQIYSHRMTVIEHVFGKVGYNNCLTRFSLRDKAKVNGQSQLYCLALNIEKL